MSERCTDVTYYNFNSTPSFYSPILIHQTYLKLGQRLHCFCQQRLRGATCHVSSTAAATRRCACLSTVVVGIHRELIAELRFLVQKVGVCQAVSCTWDTCCPSTAHTRDEVSQES